MRIIVNEKGQRIIGQTQPKEQPQERKKETKDPPASPPIVTTTTTTTTTTTSTTPTTTASVPLYLNETVQMTAPAPINNLLTQPEESFSPSIMDIDLTSILEKHEKSTGEKELKKSTDSKESQRKRARIIPASDEGYNSSDESSGGKKPTGPEDERAFEEDLKKTGFVIVRMRGDGNCLFRSIAHQVYGDPEMHDEVRKRCIEYMEKERDHYSQFVSEDFNEYVARKKKDRCYGNNLEIQAMTEIFNRPIEVYAYGQKEPINIFHGTYKTDNAPLRLSYHHGNHYNSVIDPKNPTVGVGLGLPGLKPGLADELQLEQAMTESVEEKLVEESKKEADWEFTQTEIEEAILRESEQEYWNSLIEQQLLMQQMEGSFDP